MPVYMLDMFQAFQARSHEQKRSMNCKGICVKLLKCYLRTVSRRLKPSSAE